MDNVTSVKVPIGDVIIEHTLNCGVTDEQMHILPLLLDLQPGEGSNQATECTYIISPNQRKKLPKLKTKSVRTGETARQVITSC